MTKFYRPTLNRTIRKFLAIPTKTVCCGFWDAETQRMRYGHESKHLTRSGCKYNRLIRLTRRISTKPLTSDD